MKWGKKKEENVKEMKKREIKEKIGKFKGKINAK
jgi:hypothetical protein